MNLIFGICSFHIKPQLSSPVLCCFSEKSCKSTCPTVKADCRSCPAFSCSVELSCVFRFLWFSVGRINPCSGSQSDNGLCASSLFCGGGLHELSFGTSIFRIFRRFLQFHGSNVLELVNTVNERSDTSVFTMLVSLHLFFIGSHIRTGSPGFNDFSSRVFLLCPLSIPFFEAYKYVAIFC